MQYSVAEDDADVAEVPRRDHAESVRRRHLLERASALLFPTPVDPFRRARGTRRGRTPYLGRR